MLVVAGLVTHENKVLIARRAEDQRFAGKWEFPGGKVAEGESLEGALAREFLEEFSIRVAPNGVFFEGDYELDPGRMHLVVLHVNYSGEPLRLHVHSEIAWVRPDELLAHDLLPADVDVARQILAWTHKAGFPEPR